MSREDGSGMRWLRRAVVGAVLGLGLVAGAEPSWETLSQDGWVIRVRPRTDIPGGREFWAEGELAAALPHVQAALQDHARFRLWMPHVKESRVVSEADGTRVTYTQLDLPIISNRDYVLRVQEERGVTPEGAATFLQRWSADNTVLPERHDVVRLRHNEGSWRLTALDAGRVRFVYRFAVEPGGAIPGVLAGVGQTDAVRDTVRAVEKRARRLAAEEAPAGK